MKAESAGVTGGAGLARSLAGSRPPSAPPPLSAPPPPPAAGSGSLLPSLASALPLAAGEPAGARVQERPSGARQPAVPGLRRAHTRGRSPPGSGAARARAPGIFGKTCPKRAAASSGLGGGGPKESEGVWGAPAE